MVGGGGRGWKESSVCHSEKDQLGVGVTVEEMKAHMELKRSINCGKLSASLGMLINLGEMFEERPSTTLVKEYLPFVKGKLKGAIREVVL